MTRAAPPSVHRPSPTVIHVCTRSIRPLLPLFSPVLSGAVAREDCVPRDRFRPWRDFTGHFAPSSPLRADEVGRSPICELLQIIVCVVWGRQASHKTVYMCSLLGGGGMGGSKRERREKKWRKEEFNTNKVGLWWWHLRHTSVKISHKALRDEPQCCPACVFTGSHPFLGKSGDLR